MLLEGIATGGMELLALLCVRLLDCRLVGAAGCGCHAVFVHSRFGAGGTGCLVCDLDAVRDDEVGASFFAAGEAADGAAVDVATSGLDLLFDAELPPDSTER